MSSSSATSSDDYYEPIPSEPGLEHMDDAQAAEHIFFKYRRYKKMWRRFTGRPVRKFRRTLRRHKGKGKGKGKGHGKGGHKGKGRGGRGAPFMMTQDDTLWTADDTQAFLNQRGKGHKADTSGKGFGRKCPGNRSAVLKYPQI